MFCYKDQTYCESETDNHTCGREITEEEKKEALQIGMPVAYVYFCEEPITTEVLPALLTKNPHKKS